MATQNGLIKKTRLSAYSHPRKGGINAISIRPEDDLIDAKLSNGGHDILLGTHNGLSIRFHEEEIREMGRMASGVRGIKLGADDYVVGMVVVKREGTVLVVTEKGFGKRTDIKEYRVSHRAGKGVFTVKVNEKIGKMLSLKEVLDDDDIMIITSNGIVIRQSVKKITVQGRHTQGVRWLKLDEDDKVAAIARAVKAEEYVICF